MRLSACLAVIAALGGIALSPGAMAACRDPGARAAFSQGGYYAPPEPMKPESLSYTRADGTQGSLDDFKGKPVMLSFWATWCGGCAYEAPALNKLIESYKDKGIAFVPVSIDKNANPKMIRSFLDRKGHGAISANLDPGAQLFEDFCLAGTPSHAMLDREGQLVELFVGAQPWNEPSARKYIEDVIARP